MKHLCCQDVEGFDSLALGLEGSQNMRLRLLSEDSIWIEIKPGGHTPDHTHNDKERLVVMTGKGEIKVGSERKNIKSNDFIEFDADEHHQIINNSDEMLAFVCFRNQK